MSISLKGRSMKKIILCAALFLPSFFVSCNAGGSSGLNVDFRNEMRNFVINLSEYAKTQDSAFVVIPQNGIELVTLDGESDGAISTDYLNAIDGHGQEDLLYGYTGDDQASPSAEAAYIRSFLDLSKDEGNVILVIDYCSTHAKMDDSYAQNNSAGYISFAADARNLNTIPDYPALPYGVNATDINSLTDARNFLYLINPEYYASKTDFIAAVGATDYDLLIMDLFFNDGSAFTASEIDQLKTKANGAKRMVICYMSIGEAEDYRYYWQPVWSIIPPLWLSAENPDWPGNYKVKYWNADWQRIIYGNDSSYLKKIIDAGFDGAYLDIIDAFEFYE